MAYSQNVFRVHQRMSYGGGLPIVPVCMYMPADKTGSIPNTGNVAIDASIAGFSRAE